MMTLRPVAAGLALACLARLASAQTVPVPLTLTDAIRLGTEHSEALGVAHAGEVRADAGIVRAGSQKRPQASLSGSYSRTLASEFSDFTSSTGVSCTPLTVNPSASLIDRVAELERASSCGGSSPSFDLSSLPFGQPNIYQLGFSFAQVLYAGGRISAEQRQANSTRTAARLISSTIEAQVTLDVTRAYYDAALADRLVTIAESSYTQADEIGRAHV